MKAIEIKRDGKLWKMACDGGMPHDGYIKDHSARRLNDLLEDQFHDGKISRDEWSERRLPSYREVDFCSFSRFVLWSAIKFAFAFSFLATVALLVLIPVGSFFWWILVGIFSHWTKINDLQGVGAGFLFCSALGSLAIGGLVLFRDLREKRRKTQRHEFVPTPPEVVAERINRIEIRRAFIASIKGKTCAKMIVKE